MPQHYTIKLVRNSATLATDTNVTAVTIVNQSEFPVEVQATVGATPPASWGGALVLTQGVAITAEQTLAQLFPGVVGANRVYLRSLDTAVVSVSHA